MVPIWRPDTQAAWAAPGSVDLSAALTAGPVLHRRPRAWSLLSKDDVERIVREAERFKEEDEWQHRRIDARNTLENCAYSRKSTLNDVKPEFKGKLPDDDRRRSSAEWGRPSHGLRTNPRPGQKRWRRSGKPITASGGGRDAPRDQALLRRLRAPGRPHAGLGRVSAAAGRGRAGAAH